MKTEKYPPLQTGTPVITHWTALEGDKFTEEAKQNRKWDTKGEVIGHSDSHGLCYEVKHADGTTGWYHPFELSIRGGLILPTNKIETNRQRVYFLAGPILGGGNWQQEAIGLLLKTDPECFVVCPCNYQSEQELQPYIRYGLYEVFPNQTLWERHYLQSASVHGCVIFWLPEEDQANPRPKETGPYAQDTYGELGRWSMLNGNKKANFVSPYDRKCIANVVIGGQRNFPGLRTIEKNLIADHADHGNKSVQIYETLEQTIFAAIEVAKTKSVYA